jgi:eukaryotic-like serine/threonine-protein kinase
VNERGRDPSPPSADPSAETARVPNASGTRSLAGEASPALPSQPAMWVGSRLVGGRLHVLRPLGQGGMGTVYLAFDSERRCNVALKTLNQLDAASIYQLKNEFRSLADVHHPNLVRLHELFRDADCWFFTMDVVEGQRFDEWIRAGGQLDETRLRGALLQLVDAIEAIHTAGKLHRDVKPSNVLIRGDGRLVVLDFGLVIDPAAGSVGRTLTNTEITGTPDYMAPEQALAQAATPATDYYAVGAMLHEALSGSRPYEGSIWQVLTAKLNGTPPRPLPASVPSDLAQLCAALMSREPSARPGPAEIRARIGPVASHVASTSLSAPPLEEELTALIGRDGELDALRDAFMLTTTGKAVALSITGESGIGKTALAHFFLRECERGGSAVVLSGRCYEHENVPYKAVDPVIDELSRYLRRLRPEQAAALLPRDAFALAKLFPVLSRVRAFEDAPVRNVPDPRELQRLAFTAFCELLGRIRDRSPVVVHIDDLQWTDADSAKLLRHCLVTREVVPMLFVFSHRLEDAHHPLLESIVGAIRENPSLEYRALTVEPLARVHAQALAERWLPRAADNDASSAVIATESRGNPFFAQELARFAQQTRDGTRSTPSLAALLEARIQALPEPSRKVLQALALAGRPMPIDVLLRATGADHAALDAVRDAHLVSGSESTNGKCVECYHDRVRELVCAAMSDADRTARNRGLAEALRDQDQPELLSRCLEAAGEPHAAAEHAALAAEQASLALAFDHAAELYQRALQLGAAERDNRRELLTRLGRALENTGRGSEAASAYLEAAGLSAGTESLDLQRRAAEQLLHSGEFARGYALLRGVSEALGIDLPSSTGQALVSIGWSRIQLRLRSMDPDRAAAVSGASAQDALRLRALRTAVTGLIGYKPLHAASAAGLYLRHAVQCGELADRVRALGFHAHNQGLIAPASTRLNDMLEQTVELADRDGRPEMRGFAELMQGTNAYHHERCREARTHLDRARKYFRECTGVEWEHDATNIYDQLSALYAGDYADIGRTTPSLLDQALRRRRVWAATMLSGFAGMVAWLAGDDVRGYRQKLHEARELWKQSDDPGWPGSLLLYAEALLAIYTGEPVRAFDTFASDRESARRTPISRMTLTGALGYASHRGRCAAAALRAPSLSEGYRQQLTAALRESIRTLKRRGMTRSQGLGAMLEAALCFTLGEERKAVRELRAAIAKLDEAEARMHAAAARRRLGQLIGGDEGRALSATGEAFMREQGIRELEPMTELNCPGLVST